ncbi:MAG: hypothetical protein JWN14_957, partial [Chthonomonadales bacterium]|nr:hypothetical protein [Chthonomonadales bacterium]
MALGILEGNIAKGGENLVLLETIKRRNSVSPATP